MGTHWMEHIEPLRAEVLNFIEQEVYPLEKELLTDKLGSRRGDVLRGLMSKAKAHNIWALGTHSLQDSIMLRRYASPQWRNKYLKPLGAHQQIQKLIFDSGARADHQSTHSAMLHQWRRL